MAHAGVVGSLVLAKADTGRSGKFIDENGGSPGVRLQKELKGKARK